MTSAAFFTVVYYKDYDFLLGLIEHHAQMGLHLVLDTSPPSEAITFSNLPETVTWIHEPLYGQGWREFRLRTAVESAMRRARDLKTDILVYLDSDEFYIQESAKFLFPWAHNAMVEVGNVHWKRDGCAYVFGPSEWHCRLWPRDADVEIATNVAWQNHPMYNGNPEHHPVPVAPVGMPVIRVYGEYRQHLHYALGAKAFEEETADNTIDGWPDKGKQVTPAPLPERMRLWRDEGLRPSEAFR